VITSSKNFVLDIFRKRNIIYELAKRDFQRQYQGSYLGFVWMFLQPLVFISVLYTVFSLGFRINESTYMPFSLYLIIGMICWMYFAENFSANCGIIKNHSFLVKKVDFRLSILPLVKMSSSLIPHLVLLVTVICFAWYHGYSPSLYTLQIFYYFLAMFLLLLGLGWMTSSTSIFVKDVSKVVNMLVQFGFWLTPLFWNIQMIPLTYQWIVKLNPVYYIVTGYRDSIVSRIPFWERPDETIYFWLVTLFFLWAGISVYRKLKPHFAEVI
tara:strand:- start:240 stop:1043 length:804 start_codon:yes stop_codon:yes gene_type:complete